MLILLRVMGKMPKLGDSKQLQTPVRVAGITPGPAMAHGDAHTQAEE